MTKELFIFSQTVKEGSGVAWQASLTVGLLQPPIGSELVLVGKTSTPSTRPYRYLKSSATLDGLRKFFSGRFSVARFPVSYRLFGDSREIVWQQLLCWCKQHSRVANCIVRLFLLALTMKSKAKSPPTE
jgi:hypothetical protein